MHKLFTSEDVIRFAYDEMPPDEAREFLLEMQECPEMAIEFDQINDAKNLFDKQQLNPTEKSVQNILNFSKSLYFFKSEVCPKPIEVLLN